MIPEYRSIGQKLRAFRLRSGMSADEVAEKIGTSRAAVYRFEKGHVVKIETLISLADLLGVSQPTLLGVDVEYISSAVTYFEKLRQLEMAADQITVVAGPISLLLASQEFYGSLRGLLCDSIPNISEDKERVLADVDRILEILEERRRNYDDRRPGIVNLISLLEIDRLLTTGFMGRPLVSSSDIMSRREWARFEVEHIARLMEIEPIGVQVGIVTGALPHAGFQIFRSGDRKTLAISPFRLGEQPTAALGVAMVIRSQEAVTLHEDVVTKTWQMALKGKDAASYLRSVLASWDAKSYVPMQEASTL